MICGAATDDTFPAVCPRDVPCFFFLIPACMTAKGKTDGDKSGAGTPIGVPPIAPPSFFSGVPPAVLLDVETGSPASLRRAAAALRKPDGSYTLAESVLLNICADVMRYAWPSYAQNGSFSAIEKPEVAERNTYTGALESVRLGIYDVSTGNTDFLATVLPSLILVTSSSRNDYYERAEEDLKAAVSLNGRSVLARYLLGTLYRKKGDNDAALEEFRQALSLDSSCFETQLAIANTLFLTDRIEDAEQNVARLLQLNPANSDVLKLAAELAYKQKNYSLAGDYIARILQREPENAYYLLFRARIMVMTGDYIRAASLLDAYSRMEKTSRDYLMLRARIQSEWNKNNAAAIATFEQALSLYPDDPEVILFAARLASQANQKIAGKTAGDFARAILQADPDNTEALAILVSDAAQSRQWNDAYRYSAEILRGNPSLHDQIVHVEICLALRNFSEARALSESLYARDSSDTDIRGAYLRMLTATGEHQRARSLIATWLPNARPAVKSFLYWQRSLLSASPEDKLNDLRLSLTSDPRNADALMELYRYYYGQKDYRKAQYYLRQVVALSPNDTYVLGLNAELDRLVGGN
jgi:tetratricopeptide (TPR) repeat protein